MNILEDSKEIIGDMLINKKTYDKALSSFLVTNIRNNKELDEIHKSYVTFFNHYFYYEFLTKELLSKLTPNLIAFMGVAFMGVRFFKISIDESEDFLKNALKNNKEDYSKDIEKALNDYMIGKDYEFKSFLVGSISHLSVFFNLPSWFISMVIGQQNKDIGKTVFESFKTNYSNLYIENNLANHDDIDKNELNVFVPYGTFFKTKNKESELIKNHTFINSELLYGKVFENKLNANNKYVTLYQGCKSNFYFNFLNEYLFKNNVINIAMKTFEDNPDVINEVILKKKNDLFVCESTVGELIARLSYKQDILFYMPKSTDMQRFFYCPEYRVNFDQKSIDELIVTQEKGIKEVSNYVADNGKLIYVAETIDKKETTNIVHSFLENNQDYILEKEEMFLPTKNIKSFGYYAILKRHNHA